MLKLWSQELEIIFKIFKFQSFCSYSSILLTKILPTIYPKDNCRKNQLPLYAKPGTDTNVKTDVSVATIENIAIYQRVLFPAEK